MTLGFKQSAISGQSEDIFKKMLNMVKFCLKSGGYLCVYLSLYVIEC